MDLGIKGKLALVVGASRGIGRAAAVALAAAGCEVVAVARNGDALRGLQEQLEAMGAPHECLQCDLADWEAAASLPERVIVAAGFPDIVFHAIGGSIGITAWESTAADWARVWGHNLGRAHDLNRIFVPHMVEQGWGRIVHTSSDAVKNRIGHAPYCSAKFAVEGYVKASAQLFAKDGVVMTAVAPGPIHTPGRWLYERPAEDTREYFDKYLPTRRFGRDEEDRKSVV